MSARGCGGGWSIWIGSRRRTGEQETRRIQEMEELEGKVKTEEKALEGRNREKGWRREGVTRS